MSRYLRCQGVEMGKVVLVLLLWLCAEVTVQADDQVDFDATNNASAPYKPGDRFHTGPGHGSTSSSNNMARVRCPLRAHEIFVRNATGDMVEYVDNHAASGVPTTKSSLRGSQHAMNDNDTTGAQEYFHPCWCTEYYNRPMEYCPASLRVCVVNGRMGPVQCLSHSGPASLAQVVWPTGFFYILVVAISFACTKRGAYTFQFVKRKWQTSWPRFCHTANGQRTTDDEVLLQSANNILAQGGRPALLGEDYVRRERRRLERERVQNGGTATPKPKRKKVKKPYSLKTKSFTATSSSSFCCSTDSSSDDNNIDNETDEDEEVECAICLGPLQHGDRVGDIPCGHLFHKDCLKTWLVRRKRCPLCQCQGLLTRHDGNHDKKIKAATTITTDAAATDRSDEEAPGRSGLTTGLSSTESDTMSEAENAEGQRRAASLDLEEPSNNDTSSLG